MASNYTSNYNLCQWAEGDKVLRTEFNADNAKIDAAIKAVDRRVSSLSGSSASGSAVSELSDKVDSLQTTVNGLKTSKADKSALDSLKITVNQQAAALAGKGNCQLYTEKYTGSGSYGEDSPSSLTFPAAPEAVFIIGPGRRLFLFPGMTETSALGLTSGAGVVRVSWSGKTVRWYSTNVTGQMNENGLDYYVTAFIKAG